MKNLEFIKNEIKESNDFTTEEVKIIKRNIKKTKFQKMLSQNFDYDTIDNFYQTIL